MSEMAFHEKAGRSQAWWGCSHGRCACSGFAVAV